MRDEFSSHYSDQPDGKFQYISNGYDPDQRHKIDAILQQAQQDNTRQQFRICHAGELYGRRDPRSFLSAVRRLVDLGWDLVFEQIGAVEPVFRMETFVRENNLTDNVIIKPPVPHRQALESLARADVLLIIQPDTNVQIPGKLFEMMMFRKPIIAIVGNGGTADIIKRFDLGTIGNPNDVDDIVDAIREARLRVASGRAQGCWEDALNAYDGRNLTSKLAELLKNITIS